MENKPYKLIMENKPDGIAMLSQFILKYQKEIDVMVEFYKYEKELQNKKNKNKL